MQFGVSESIAHWGRYRPDTPAVYHGGNSTSFSELNALINRVSNHLVSMGKLGERVGVAVSSKLHFLVCLVGVVRAGHSVVVLNTGLSALALTTNISETGIQTLLYDTASERVAHLVLQRGGNVVDVRDVVAMSEASSSCFPDVPNRAAGDEWGVLFSSGTTGIPKGILRDHESMVTELLGWCLELGLTRQDRFYIGRPLFYTGGLVLTLSALLVGGAVVLNDFKDDNNADEVWTDYQATLASHPVTWAFFVPDQLRSFTARAKQCGEEPLNAGSVLVMGSAISGAEKVAGRQYLGSRIIESWGNSESLGTITDPEDVDVRPDSVGRPFLTDGLCVVNDDCEQLPAGQYGRIAGSQEAGFKEYCSQREATQRVKRGDLIVSEDIGYVAEDGYFYVCGRVQDCVRVGTRMIFVSRIEAKIREQVPGIECCVAATDLGNDHIRLVAVVAECGAGSDVQIDLCGQLNSALPHGERLEDIVLVEALPRVPSGKVDRVAVQSIVDRAS